MSRATIVRIDVEDGTVSYSGYYNMSDSNFWDLSAIYEDPYYEGGNLLAVAT